MFHSICTICRDVLTQDLLACPCGHVYHNNCLTAWFACSKRTCPTCRKSCTNSIQLYFSDHEIDEDSTDNNIGDLKNELRKQLALLKEKDIENNTIKKECTLLGKHVDEYKETIHDLNKRLQQANSVKTAIMKQVGFLNEVVEEKKTITKELNFTKTKLLSLQRFQKMVEGSYEEAQEMVNRFGDGPKTGIELASQLVIMKRELEKMGEAKKKALTEKNNLEKRLCACQNQLKTHKFESSTFKKILESIEERLKNAEDEKASLKKKVEKLQGSLQSASPRTAIINRLLQESPIPQELKKPTLTCPKGEDDVFTNDTHESSLSTTPKTTAVSSEKVFLPVHPGAHRLPLSRKRAFPYMDSRNDTGRLRTCFDGLGGRKTIITPFLETSKARKVGKKVGKPVKISQFVVNMKSTDPPLPHL